MGHYVNCLQNERMNKMHIFSRRCR